MNKIVICEKCKKDSDSVLLTFFVGDEKELLPGTKVNQWRCKRCKCVVLSNEKMFKIVENS